MTAQFATPVSIQRKVRLNVGNRDGYVWAVQTTLNEHYLVLEADTLCNPEVFPGMGSTEHISITKSAFDALTT